MTSLPPFLINSPRWDTEIANKHLLFDTDSIIQILEYKAEKIFDVFTKNTITPCTIDPVTVELKNTNNPIEFAKRQNLINKYLETLPLIDKDFSNGKNIQTWLASQKIYKASPTDIYLGGKLAFFKHNNILLLTGNISDFPYPLYDRVNRIILQNEQHSCVLHILRFVHSVISIPSMKTS